MPGPPFIGHETSDLDPVGLEESGTDPEHYQRDKNLDKRPIQIFVDPAAGKTETFPKGLTLKAKTIITYELKGQYNFSARLPVRTAFGTFDADRPSHFDVQPNIGVILHFGGKRFALIE